MSDSDKDESNLEDEEVCEGASQDSQIGPENEEEEEEEEEEEDDDDESFEPSSGTTDYESDKQESDHDSDNEEPTRKRPKRETPKKSHKKYEWKNKSHPPSNSVNQTTSSAVKVKEEHISLDPLTIFNKYFDNPFIQLIVKLTNDNALRKGKTLELTEAELKAYFGMLVIMSFHRLPNLNNYWQKDQNLSVPRISKLMRYRRFSDIGRYLCFSTEAKVHKKGEKQQIALGLVRPLVDHLNEKFCQIRHPSQPLSVDLSTIRPKNWKDQYTQSGEKHFSVLAIGCGKTGYIFRINVRGPGKDFRSELDNRVRDITSPFEGSGYPVYIARKISSFPLIEELYDKQIFACCELKQNDPNIPAGLRNETMKMETGRFVQCGDFSITKWKDSQRHYSYIFSTFHDPAEKALRRNNGNPENQNPLRLSTDEEEPSSLDTTTVNTRNTTSRCPRVVENYKYLKQGIRIFDNRRLAYSTSWKNYSWTNRLFYYMLDVTLVNSHLVYESSWESMEHHDNEKRLSCVEFRSELADNLIGGFVGKKPDEQELQVRQELQNTKKQSSKASRGLHSTAKNSTRHQDVGRHLPVKNKVRRCANCSMQGKEKRSTVSCKACNVGLCIPCFVPFHTT